MYYAYPVLAPQGTSADKVLAAAAAAPSLQHHLVKVSAVNSTYSQLRDAAWSQAQPTGNFTPEPRLLPNLDRARSLPATGRFMVVDSAAQRLTLYEGGRPVDTMKVIVGAKDLPTPLIASVVYYVSFNPYWNAPHRLVRTAIAPNVLRHGVGYLSSRGYEVMADWSRESVVLRNDKVNWPSVALGKTQIRIRQKPGVQNSMGTLKFPFQNAEDIYLHDTPNKAPFASDRRYISNGCVRVEDAARLGRWLLGREAVPPGPEPEIWVALPRGVPIYITYLTAQVRDGQISYLSDIYGWDTVGPRLASPR
jgi:murein L,D-transpeptidase YcbB/YkuD